MHHRMTFTLLALGGQAACGPYSSKTCDGPLIDYCFSTLHFGHHDELFGPEFVKLIRNDPFPEICCGYRYDMARNSNSLPWIFLSRTKRTRHYRNSGATNFLDSIERYRKTEN
ncbi:unnamed protein product [Gongylonema pulchrum]|uniref:Secreted protein n=1 Tax=Gongylonema pulchrum TaxID=637853 RepID=A0A183DT22_9BILA|nr:unnamed protein product [Gongylonema pulchrum]